MSSMRQLKQRLHQSADWFIISICLLSLVGLLAGRNSLSGTNNLIQDYALASLGRTLQGKVVIVSIDDKSIAQLGRWPWRRVMHTELLDRIHADHAKAIGLDILFVEPDQQHPDDDALLTRKIRQTGSVVLPVLVQNHNNSPVASLQHDYASAAKSLGHAHLNIDSDGVVRSIYLQEKTGAQTWQNFGLAMLEAAGQPITQQDIDSISSAHATDNQTPQTDLLTQKHLMLIPYAGPIGTFPRISYVDVLNGNFEPGTFTGKYVLVGATAAGVGDQYATPTTNTGRLMPGVEVLANITDALLSKQTLKTANHWQNIALNLIFVFFALLGFRLLEPLAALLLTLSLGALLTASTYLAVSVAGILFAPSAGLLGLAVLYPLWSWHRLDVAMRYLTHEFNLLQQDTGYLYVNTQSETKDFLDKRIAALEGATNQLRNLHTFVSASVNALPYPTLICGTDSIVRIANMAATQHFYPDQTIRETSRPLIGERLCLITQDIISNEHSAAVVTAPLIALQANIEAEARDSLGRELLVKCTPCFNQASQHTGWIFSLIDVTKLWQAERDRDEAFRFITHDIRSPLSSIISLLELQAIAPEQASLANSVNHNSLLSKIKQQANKALMLADDFVQLSRAKSGIYTLNPVNLSDLLNEVVDDPWPQAQMQNININKRTPDEAWAIADHAILKRALTNLLSNAIKFSPADAKIDCSIQESVQLDSKQIGKIYWDITFTDQGPGISQQDQASLFQPYKRFHTHSHPQIAGTGLGLAFVYHVAIKLQGKVTVDSQESGSIFHLYIPQASNDE